MFDKFGELLTELAEYDFDVVRSRGSLALQQTQRNDKKAELMVAFFEGMKELGEEHGFDVYQTGEGVIIELRNEGVMKKVKRMREASEKDVMGFISIEHNLKIKNLDYDAELEETLFLEELAAAEEDAKRKEEAKKAKIKQDAELRASKSRLREQRIAQIIKDGNVELRAEREEDTEGDE